MHSPLPQLCVSVHFSRREPSPFVSSQSGRRAQRGQNRLRCPTLGNACTQRTGGAAGPPDSDSLICAGSAGRRQALAGARHQERVWRLIHSSSRPFAHPSFHPLHQQVWHAFSVLHGIGEQRLWILVLPKPTVTQLCKAWASLLTSLRLLSVLCRMGIIIGLVS